MRFMIVKWNGTKRNKKTNNYLKDYKEGNSLAVYSFQSNGRLQNRALLKLSFNFWFSCCASQLSNCTNAFYSWFLVCLFCIRQWKAFLFLLLAWLWFWSAQSYEVFPLSFGIFPIVQNEIPQPIYLLFLSFFCNPDTALLNFEQPSNTGLYF